MYSFIKYFCDVSNILGFVLGIEDKSMKGLNRNYVILIVNG